jgi:acyl-[acyl-carrier-protein] desaturase
MVIYGYLMVTRAIDPVALERHRMHQVSGGLVPEPESVCNGFFYVAMQELATRIAHRNTGTLLNDPAGYDVMMRVAADENRHYLFYRDLSTAAFELDPSKAMLALRDEVVNFEMPGAGIIDFARHAAAIAKAGIYDLSSHHDQILQPLVLRHWNIENITGLDDEAERARDKILSHIAKNGRVAKRLAERRLATVG